MHGASSFGYNNFAVFTCVVNRAVGIFIIGCLPHLCSIVESYFGNAFVNENQHRIQTHHHTGHCPSIITKINFQSEPVAVEMANTPKFAVEPPNIWFSTSLTAWATRLLVNGVTVIYCVFVTMSNTQHDWSP